MKGREIFDMQEKSFCNCHLSHTRTISTNHIACVRSRFCSEIYKSGVNRKRRHQFHKAPIFYIEKHGRTRAFCGSCRIGLKPRTDSHILVSLSPFRTNMKIIGMQIPGCHTDQSRSLLYRQSQFPSTWRLWDPWELQTLLSREGSTLEKLESHTVLPAGRVGRVQSRTPYWSGDRD